MLQQLWMWLKMVFPFEGDITHVSQKITIDPEGQHEITIDNITVQN